MELAKVADLPLLPATVALLVGLAILAASAGLRTRWAMAGWISLLAGIWCVFFLGYIHAALSDLAIKRESAHILELARREEEQVLTGVVIRAPVPTENGARAVVSLYALHTPVGDEPIQGRISLALSGVLPRDVAPGDLIRFEASLRPVRNYRTPGAFDMESWWKTQGVMVSGRAASLSRVAFLGHLTSSPDLPAWRYLLESARHRLLTALCGPMQDHEFDGIAAALLTGEKTWISAQTREAFSRTGTSHLLAVSGLHMALVSLLAGGGVYFLLLRSGRLLLYLNARKISLSIATIAAFLYAGLAGFSPSAVRAFLMIAAFGAAFLADRPQNPFNTLAIAAFLILAFEPRDLTSLSFQLSFAAVFFLILFFRNRSAQTRGDPLPWPRRVLDNLKGLAAVTLVASLATAPLISLYFPRLSLAAIPANLILVPLATFLIMPLLLLGAILFFLGGPGAGALPWNAAAWIFSPVIPAMEVVSGWRWAAPPVPRPDCATLFLLYGILAYAAMLAEDKRKTKAVLIAIFFLLLTHPVQGWIGKIGPKETRLHVLDVGQGTAQVVEFPDGSALVMDGGGGSNPEFDIGERIVAPFLRSLGIRKIWAVAASHPERDHIGGLPALLDMFSVDEFWRNSDTSRTHDWKRLEKNRIRNEIPERVFTKRTRIEHAGVMIEVWPPDRCAGLDSLNARSLVLVLETGGRRMLLSGDMDTAREACLVDADIGDMDVVVVPHHGSRTSSSLVFLHEIRPEIAIVPVGYRNPFRLPNDEVMKRYEGLGCALYRTDQDGTVTITISDGSLDVSTYTPGDKDP